MGRVGPTIVIKVAPSRDLVASQESGHARCAGIHFDKESGSPSLSDAVDESASRSVDAGA